MPSAPRFAWPFALVCALQAGPAPGAAADLPPVDYLRIRLQADSLAAARQDSAAAAHYRRLLGTRPDDPELAARLARQLYRQRLPAEALPHARRGLAGGFANEQEFTYRIAMEMARIGQRDSALAWLERSLAAPLEDRGRIGKDEAFAALRDDPRFRALAGEPVPASIGREAGWALDLDFVLAEARRLHASPRRPAWDPAFAAALDDLERRVPRLDDVGVAMELQRIIATHLGDGHSVVYPFPTPRVAFGMLPVAFHFFADGLFVVDATPAHRDLVGRRVTAIGGREVAGLRADLAGIVSRDNDQGVLWLGPLYLRLPAVLRSLGYAPTLDGAELAFQEGPGARLVVPEGPPAHGLGLGAAPGQGAPAPWLARRGEAYWREARPEMDALYVQLNRIGDAEQGPGLAAFAEATRAELEKDGARHLILDLRHNDGGNNNLNLPLVRLVIGHELRGGGRRTFVVTGRGTFSACQNLVNRLDELTDAVFVGEPSSSKPNFAGEDTPVMLPWSGLRLSIASRWWQDGSPLDRRAYVAVSMPVDYTSADWKAGRDPVMEALAGYLATR